MSVVRYGLVGLLVAPCACGDTVHDTSSAPDSATQGLYGTVHRTVGDLEPQPGGAPAVKEPLAVPVLAVRGGVPIVVSTGFADVPDAGELDVVANTMSSSEGEYELAVAPGTYTVLAVIGNDYAVPCHTGDSACSYLVDDDVFIRVDINRHYP